MGIGAYQCREYVHSLGGEIEVKSEPQEGTRFIIRLPVAAGVESGTRIESNAGMKHAANMK
jgi:signal transduction histidine kinase